MSCTRFDDWLTRQSSGEWLPLPEEMVRHAGQCPECAGRIQAAQALRKEWSQLPISNILLRTSWNRIASKIETSSGVKTMKGESMSALSTWKWFMGPALAFCLILVLVFSRGPMFRSGSPEAGLATVKSLRGLVQVKMTESASWETAREGMRMAAGGLLRTGEDGHATIGTSEGDTMTFCPDTCFEFQSGDGICRQTAGKIQYHITPKAEKEFKIQTQHAVTAVLGTVFTIELQKSSTEISLFQGRIRVQDRSSKGERILEPGQGARITDSSLQVVSFEIPNGFPLGFSLPATNPGGGLIPSTGANSGAKTEPASTTVPGEDQNRIDLNEGSSGNTASTGTSSLQEILSP